MRWSTAIALALCLASTACKKEEPLAPPPVLSPDATCTVGGALVDVEDEEPPDVACDRSDRAILCAGDWAVLCDGERRVDATNCRLTDEKCYERPCDDPSECARCLACKPNAVRCLDDGERERCNEDGSEYEPEEPCDEGAGLYCDQLGGRCTDLCAEAEAERSYIGCEYYAVSTSNSPLELEEVDGDGLCQPFSFAIVVANGEGVPARVTIESPGGATLERTVGPGETQAINLPCSLELTGQGPVIDDEGNLIERFSSVGVDGAHHITSNVPITVYQFNPLEFESETAERTTYSYTNDASLLLPVSALTGNYMATTVPTLLHVLEVVGIEDPVRLIGPGFITIVGVSDEPTDVEIHATAFTLPSADGTLPALEPGDTATITLERGQVAQILSAAPEACEGDEQDEYNDGSRRYCEVSRDYDLSGTRVTASNPVMVVSGHDCAFVPFNRWACDHVEEVMQPLESWGKDIIVAITAQPECRDPQPNIVRVVASHDDTRVEFEPEDAHDPVTLDEGELVEAEISADLRVVASKGISVSQLLVGQDYDGRNTSSFTKGDPSLSVAIPAEQWRKRYSILTPETFTDNFVGVIAREDQLVLLDGRVITRMSPVEGTPFATARLQIPSGQHTLESSQSFGVTVYGYALYSSYMVAGGLDLNLINPPQ